MFSAFCLCSCEHQGRLREASVDSSAAASGQEGRCLRTNWTRPQAFFAGPSDARAARGGALLSRDNDVLVIGNDIRFFDLDLRRGDTFVAKTRSGHELGAPPGSLWYASPRAARLLNGDVAVMWAEPDVSSKTVAAADWPKLEFTSIWGSNYSRNRGWTKPVKLFAGALRWSRETNGDIHETAGDLVVSAPLLTGKVVVLSVLGGEWSAEVVETKKAVVYTSVLSVAGRQLLAAVAADDQAPSDINSVFLYSREPEGGQWRLSLQVQRSGALAASEPRLLATLDGRLLLMWRQEVVEGRHNLRLVVSEDSGKTWSEPHDLAVGRPIHRVQAAVSSCGLDVVYEDWSAGPTAIRLGHARWDGTWRGPKPIHSGFFASDPVLTVEPGARIAIAFWGTESSPDDRSAFRMWYSSSE